VSAVVIAKSRCKKVLQHNGFFHRRWKVKPLHDGAIPDLFITGFNAPAPQV
jgi:hypothetical protein